MTFVSVGYNVTQDNRIIAKTSSVSITPRIVS